MTRYDLSSSKRPPRLDMLGGRLREVRLCKTKYSQWGMSDVSSDVCEMWVSSSRNVCVYGVDAMEGSMTRY